MAHEDRNQLLRMVIAGMDCEPRLIYGLLEDPAAGRAEVCHTERARGWRTAMANGLAGSLERLAAALRRAA